MPNRTVEALDNEVLVTITKDYLLVTIKGQSYRRPVSTYQLLGLNVATAKALSERIREDG